MEQLILTVILTSVPLIFAASGELIAERSGVLNLGVEGMMLMGAVSAFAVAMGSGSPVLGMFAGAFAGAITAGIFAFFALGLATNQVATGLALTIFGTGLSGLIGAPLVGHAIDG
ncbi:MAG: ABC transporter permease subunit, partial [Candidatus Puniceispirillaceae bacterium]